MEVGRLMERPRAVREQGQLHRLYSRGVTHSVMMPMTRTIHHQISPRGTSRKCTTPHSKEMEAASVAIRAKHYQEMMAQATLRDQGALTR